MVNITNYVIKESLTKKMTSTDSFNMLKEFMNITAFTKVINFTKGWK